MKLHKTTVSGGTYSDGNQMSDCKHPKTNVTSNGQTRGDVPESDMKKPKGSSKSDIQVRHYN